ncbi:TerD family protein [Rhodococcus qingshengii]|uniref:TerD domain-containing protein n=1 Tax=Rhodococcus qingshengii TaxID=334542 RepID=A0A2A5J476_RHOSG|nr:TerD family protein [Rhodococcus qingshengii]PCK24395.1 hypothetical protein CHR55_26255 [Rhodococcus qingshengii]
MQLSKGQNASFDQADVTVCCTWEQRPSIDADLSALLLAADGNVRGDFDFVFYNQAESRDDSTHHGGKRIVGTSVEDRITVDLHRLDQEIERIAIVLSLDAPPPATLAGLGAADISVHDPTGNALAMFTIDDWSSETAAVTVEIYRRDHLWKIRAVGQGYHDGLAGLARDFGVTIDDDTDTATAETVAATAVSGPPPLDWSNPPVPAGYEL